MTNALEIRTLQTNCWEIMWPSDLGQYEKWEEHLDWVDVQTQAQFNIAWKEG